METKRRLWTVFFHCSQLPAKFCADAGGKRYTSARLRYLWLNQVVRPFTAKWHKESLAGAFSNEGKQEEFRKELVTLQEELRNYNRLLAEIASVEDLTDMEQTKGE